MVEVRSSRFPALGSASQSCSNVPTTDHPSLAFVAEKANRRCVQRKKSTRERRHSNPTCGKDPQQVSVGEEGDIPSTVFDYAVKDAASPNRNLIQRLSIGYRSEPDRPFRYLLPDIECGPTFIDTVVPFLQVLIELRIGVTREPGRLSRAIERAAPDFELQTSKGFLDVLSCAPACFGERHICAARMASGRGPFGFSVPNQEDLLCAVLHAPTIAR